MSTSTPMKELPETSMWHGAVSEEDVALVRRRHAEKVEEWLEFADFATELFKLHEKYGIEKGEEGYFAYRKHLRTNYYHKLQTYGPTPDPLDEGCDCIFCKMHTEPEDGTDQPATEKNHHVAKSNTRGNLNDRRLGQVPAESPTTTDQSAEHKPRFEKLGPVPAYRGETESRAAKKSIAAPTAFRTLNVDHAIQEGHCEPGPHSGPYATKKNHRVAKSNTGSNRNNRRLGQAPAETPNITEQPSNPNPQFEKLGPIPTYRDETGERSRRKKMSGSVF